ncbi:substrate-binding domain-containing protein [Cronbergia sp. UHCC 0137]|uniref:PstS family phosphate ABC transporter substrate-binding protein n=1 Tax=Cronbergia sp. UHCC 0137 TaxID=3110239 RepID=UPI002B1FD535|nr:substrate-binding domain-containing protein [Cronbergia sp. UHCC 0137]MEA5617660.1 substrate-binding domain-containing protein [Cronbergia sp. UHCC 0137]
MKAIPLIIVFGILKLIWDEALNPLLGKIFGYSLKITFFLPGKYLHEFAKKFGLIPVLLISMPLVFCLCFLSTVLDYHAIVSNLEVSINIFSDRTVKNISEINYTSNMISWMREDCVSRNNFLDYWWYSQRASILGFRINGFWQWIIALPVNLIAGIWFFYQAVNNTGYGFLGSKINFDDKGNLIYDTSSINGQIPTFHDFFTVILSFLMALIVIINAWGWVTEGSRTDLSTAIKFSDVRNIPTGTFNYGGSTTWATIRRDVDSVIQNYIPQYRLNYVNPPNISINNTPGSATGIRMLIDGKLNFSQSSRPLKPDEKEQAKKKRLTLKQVNIGMDGIVFAVNPKLKIQGLTINDLKNIYSGKINNWKQLGGQNLKITPYSRRAEDGGSVDFMIKDVLKINKFGENVKFVEDTTNGLRKLYLDRGGIYYASAPEVVNQCPIKPLKIGLEKNKLISPYKLPLVPPNECPRRRNALDTEVFVSGKYPIKRQLFVIINQNGKLQQKAGETYAKFLLTEQGQNLISKAGFIRLPRTNCSK